MSIIIFFVVFSIAALIAGFFVLRLAYLRRSQNPQFHNSVSEASNIRNLQKLRNFCLLLFFLVGGLSSFWFSKRWEFLSLAMKAPANVVRIDYSSSEPSGKRGRTIFAWPVFEYEPVPGQIVQVKAQYGTKPPRYSVGDKLTLFYNPQDFNSVLEDGGPYLNYQGPTLVGLLSLFFLFIALCLPLVLKNRVAHQELSENMRRRQWPA